MSGMNFAICFVTSAVCNASSYVGDKQMHWKNQGATINTIICLSWTPIRKQDSMKQIFSPSTWQHFWLPSTLLNIVKTNAAVFPVPLWDWAIIFVGLVEKILRKCWEKIVCHKVNTRWNGSFTDQLKASVELSLGFLMVHWSPYCRFPSTIQVF